MFSVDFDKEYKMDTPVNAAGLKSFTFLTVLWGKRQIPSFSGQRGTILSHPMHKIVYVHEDVTQKNGLKWYGMKVGHFENISLTHFANSMNPENTYNIC